MQGLCEQTGESASILICPHGTKAANFAFDVTPARLITGLITERGVCAADESSILSVFPELGGLAESRKRKADKYFSHFSEGVQKEGGEEQDDDDEEEEDGEKK